MPSSRPTARHPHLRPARRPSWAAGSARLLAAPMVAIVLGLGLAGWLPAVRPAHAQTGLVVTSAPPPDLVFGVQARFHLEAQSSRPITRARLFLLPASASAPTVYPAKVDRSPTISLTLTLDLAVDPLPPFTLVTYWWDVADASGRTITSKTAAFFYEDTRFAWQDLSSGPLTVHWYDQPAPVGQLALNVAVTTLSQANRDIRAPLPDQLDLYLYTAQADVIAALQRLGGGWADGHASPELGVVIAVIPPGLDADVAIRREIPHELTHVLVAKAAGEHMDSVPAWLNEGLAVLNQVQTDPDFPVRLSAARDASQLLSLNSLCGPFLPDPVLAYAQSESFVRYIRQTFGSEGLNALLQRYAAGDTCSGGVEASLGMSLSQLEDAWLAEVMYPNAVAPRWHTAAPWVLLAGLVLTGPALFFLAATRRLPRA